MYTDHCPLLLFKEEKSNPILAAARMQRWAAILSAYIYNIIYKPGPDLVEADTLSRLPITDVFSPEDSVNFIAPFPAVPMTAKK